MTFYIIISAASFWIMWQVVPVINAEPTLGASILGGMLTIMSGVMIISCCILVYKVAKERLKVDPHYLDKPADHE